MSLYSILNNNFPSHQNAIRLFHGRGGKTAELEHIVVDYYFPTLFVTLYKETSEELLLELRHLPIENILVQKRFLTRPELYALKGMIPTEANALEDSLKFQLTFGVSQNIGFFLDMATGRSWLKEHSKNKKVLNLFSYTCSLSVAALTGGAEEVINVDMSKAALNVGRDNHRLNNIDLKKVKFFSYDIMNSWNNIKRAGPYDIIIIDPPTNQGDSFKVERDYYKIVKRLDAMTNPGAIILACLNAPKLQSQFLVDLFKEHALEFSQVGKIDSAFQAMESNPEEGLKIVLFQKLA